MYNMKNLFLINEDEKSRILNLHETATKRQYLVEQPTLDLGQPTQPISTVSTLEDSGAIVKKGLGGDPYIYGKLGNDYYYAKESDGDNPNWILAVKERAINSIKSKIYNEKIPVVKTVKAPVKATSKKQQVKTTTKTTTKPIVKKESRERCIALSKGECAKISSTKEVLIGSGSETRCSAYMVKCLSQYDSELYGGNAWDVFNNVKNGGSVKYNAFTSGEINWNNIWSQLVKNKVSKSVCTKHASIDDADKQVKSAVPSIVTNSVPSSPKINLSSLRLGDIVGLYHKNSANKGMAFCQRALKRGLDNNGNVSDKDPFTFNSHVGFVGAIKNGIPVIIHNVHGSHMATPATQMMNKNSEDMIVWVVSDNDVSSSIQKSV
jgi:hypothetical protein